MKVWKQPIDKRIYDWFGDDHLVRDLFLHLILKAQNEDMKEPKMLNNKTFQLQRGQVLFGRNTFSKILRCSPSGAERALHRLAKVYSKVTSKPSKNYTVITILNYDELVRMNKQKNKRVTSKEQESNTLKNDKSVKSEENDKIYYGDHVFLKPGKYEKLCEQLTKPVVDDIIESMNLWVPNKGPYKDYSAAIRIWAKRNKKGKQNGQYKTKTERDNEKAAEVLALMKNNNQEPTEDIEELPF